MLNTVVNPMLNLLGGGGNKGNMLLQIGGSFNSLAGTLTPMFVGALIGDITKERIVSGEITITNINPVLFIALGVFAAAFLILSFIPILLEHNLILPLFSWSFCSPFFLWLLNSILTYESGILHCQRLY